MKLGMYFGRHAGGGGGMAVYAQALLREALQQIASGTFPSNALLVYVDEVVFSAAFRESLKSEGYDLIQRSKREWLISSPTQQAVLRILWTSVGRKLGLIFDQLVLPFRFDSDGVLALHSVANLGLVRFRGQQLVTVHDLFQAYPPGSETLSCVEKKRANRAVRASCATEGSSLKSALNKIFYRTLFSAQFKRASDYFICDLDSVVSEIIGRYRVPAARITSITLGIDPAIEQAAQFSRIEARRVIESSVDSSRPLPTRYALLIASSDLRKNTLLQLRAWEMTHSAHNLSLVVLCQDREIEERINQMAVPRVTTLAHQEREVFAALLRAAEVLLFATRQEGFGLPLLEALSCQILVISGSDEAVQDHPSASECLFLCDPTSVESIVDALQRADRELPVNPAGEILEHPADHDRRQPGFALRTMQQAVQETITKYQTVVFKHLPPTILRPEEFSNQDRNLKEAVRE